MSELLRMSTVKVAVFPSARGEGGFLPRRQLPGFGPTFQFHFIKSLFINVLRRPVDLGQGSAFAADGPYPYLGCISDFK